MNVQTSKSKYTDFSVPLLSDEYQFTMAYSHFQSHKHNERAVYEIFYRVNPFEGEYSIFAGVEEVLSFIKYFKITEEDIKYLRKILPKDAKEEFFEWLRTLDCQSIKLYTFFEGSIVFPKEPLIQVEGPLSLLLILETPLITLTSFPTLVATNASRYRRAAGELTLLEFGLRRAQSPGAALAASRYLIFYLQILKNFRYAYIGGFDQTSNLLAASKYDIPVSSTMSHAFVTSYTFLDEIEEFYINEIPIKQRSLYYREQLGFDKTSDSELASFLSYAKSFPNQFICLVDSFDSLKSGVPNFIIVSMALTDAKKQPVGIRLDSGDLIYLSVKTRQLIDKAASKMNKDLSQIKIMASEGIDEQKIREFNNKVHAINIFAVGTDIVTCKHQPHMGIVYKLVEINGQPKLKFSEEAIKSTLPGLKSVYRIWVNSQDGPVADVIALPDEEIIGQNRIKVVSLVKTAERYTILPKKIERLLHLVWDQGEIVRQFYDIKEIVATEKYWAYFQNSAENALIPKIIA
ncbi:nicotinate phosphoribosyltransferase-like protein, putative [Ichthyophthirius multifiliis]|uniref:Nicotinate phosphoribosyltransferase n=1 Tax=Ichthyophthirius multifiliis TaxID=5932 RepID=G0QTY3_ICHMU|nr:nicotinate phosphoribosyltransferase-like protein, putative [Ichthyophthirius multifiliis]EGR31342.1 nicotinate phosphoribosyltransferase-like protein, putative [Ichthyophthirius multifiliis]|eukprot:XP_004034828.1 nicotinate phosphoribosyltransferase-like protein, putative [Ichthyophthirius multifiliis]